MCARLIQLLGDISGQIEGVCEDNYEKALAMTSVMDNYSDGVAVGGTAGDFAAAGVEGPNETENVHGDDSVWHYGYLKSQGLAPRPVSLSSLENSGIGGREGEEAVAEVSDGYGVGLVGRLWWVCLGVVSFSMTISYPRN